MHSQSSSVCILSLFFGYCHAHLHIVRAIVVVEVVAQASRQCALSVAEVGAGWSAPGAPLISHRHSVPCVSMLLRCWTSRGVGAVSAAVSAAPIRSRVAHGPPLVVADGPVDAAGAVPELERLAAPAPPVEALVRAGELVRVSVLDVGAVWAVHERRADVGARPSRVQHERRPGARRPPAPVPVYEVSLPASGDVVPAGW